MVPAHPCRGKIKSAYRPWQAPDPEAVMDADPEAVFDNLNMDNVWRPVRA